jgi:hypothetical protein
MNTATFSPLTIEPGMCIMCTWHVTRSSETIAEGTRYQTLTFGVDQAFAATGDGPSKAPASFDLTILTGSEQTHRVLHECGRQALAEQLGLADGLQLRVVATSTGLQVTDSDEVTSLHLAIIGTVGPMAVAT